VADRLQLARVDRQVVGGPGGGDLRQGAAAADVVRLFAVNGFGEGAGGRGLDHEAFAVRAGHFVEAAAALLGPDPAGVLQLARLAGLGRQLPDRAHGRLFAHELAEAVAAKSALKAALLAELRARAGLGRADDEGGVVRTADFIDVSSLAAVFADPTRLGRRAGDARLAGQAIGALLTVAVGGDAAERHFDLLAGRLLTRRGGGQLQAVERRGIRIAENEAEAFLTGDFVDRLGLALHRLAGGVQDRTRAKEQRVRHGALVALRLHQRGRFLHAAAAIAATAATLGERSGQRRDGEGEGRRQGNAMSHLLLSWGPCWTLEF
jgi:hypothetical protein